MIGFIISFVTTVLKGSLASDFMRLYPCEALGAPFAILIDEIS